MAETVRIADRSWLDAPPTCALIAAFDSAGIDFRFVGGAVRDSLLGRPVSDVDVATPARPEAVLVALDAARIKSVPTGLSHGTVTAIVEGRPFEITTLRRDVETDGRHATVAFSTDWREDAARRDFTMNALYADRDGAVMDFFGGVADARAGHVRFIGDPATRITEDALRILRFFRFHAHYGHGEPDAEGSAACARLAAMIDGLSGERIRDELLKLLGAPDPVSAWRAMERAGVVVHLLPNADSGGLARMVAIERALRLEPDALRRLAALGGTEALKKRLKLSNRDARRLAAMHAPGPRTTLVVREAFGRALYGGEPDDVRDAALLAHVRASSPDVPVLQRFLEFLATWREPKFPLNGADLQRLGVAEGAELGRLLAEIELWWITSDFAPDRAACLAELERALRARRPPEAAT